MQRAEPMLPLMCSGYTAAVDEQEPTSLRQMPQMPPNRVGRFSDLLYCGRVLRAGWGLLIFPAVTLGLLFIGTQVMLRFHAIRLVGGPYLTLRSFLPSGAILFALLASTAVMAVLEQRRFEDYGFVPRRAVRQFMAGAIAGVLVVSSLLFTLHQLGYAVFRGQILEGAKLAAESGVLWALYFGTTALLQIAMLTGYLQYDLTRGVASLLRHYFSVRLGTGTAFWIAAALLASGSVAMHTLNRSETLISLAVAGLLTLLLAASVWRSGAVWWAVGFHLAWNWSQSWLFGVPAGGVLIIDHLTLTEPRGPIVWSGGLVGPEGSLLAPAALLVALLSLRLLKRRKAYPDLWAEAAREAQRFGSDFLPDPGGRPR